MLLCPGQLCLIMIDLHPDRDYIERQIKTFLQEDVGSGDVTASLIAKEVDATAEILTRQSMILCGRSWVDEVFEQLGGNCRIDWQVQEGQSAPAGTVLATLNGQARALLTGERTALNLLQTLSSTATVSHQYAQAVANTGCKVLDTRKTIPGLRAAQKYAVHCGGCYNHRMGLYDAILIKENHILAAGSITHAIHLAKQHSDVPVEVEVENLDEFREALTAQPNRIMLDNFNLGDLQQAVTENRNKVELEASGNIDLKTIHDVALTGVDYISIGALTKNLEAIDLSMRIKLDI